MMKYIFLLLLFPFALAAQTPIRITVGSSGGGSTDTASLSSRINLKANIANPTFTGVAKLGSDTLATRSYARANGGGGYTGETEEFDLDSAITALFIVKGLVPNKTMGITLVDGEIVLTEVTAGGGPVDPSTVVWTYDDFDTYWAKPTGGTTAIDGANTVPVIGAPVYTFVGGNQGYGGIMRRNETLVNNGTYKFVIYLKRVNYDYVGIRLPGGIVGENYPFINLSTLATDNLDQDHITMTATALTEGWIKLEVLTTAAINTNTLIDVALVNSTGGVFYNPLGTSSLQVARSTLLTTP